MNVQGFMIWVTIGAVIILIAEVLSGRHRNIYRRQGEVPLIVSSMVARFTLGGTAGIVAAMLYSAILPHYRGALEQTPLWLAVPGVILFGEFCFYWVHRYSHETSKRKSLLWMLHRTHHSARYMNVAVWMRLNLFWYFVIPNAWTMGLALYLGLGDAAGIYIVLNAVWNIVTHSAFRWDDPIRRHRVFGPAFRAIEHVIVSPGIHHTHHGFGKDGASYRNYGVLLSFWDWVFGTLHIPDGRPYRYGLPGHDAHWLEEFAYPLIRRGRKGAVPATTDDPQERERNAANPIHS